MAGTTYIVSQFTSPGNAVGGAGLGDINPKTYTNPTDAAKDYMVRNDIAARTYLHNRDLPAGGKLGILETEIHAVGANGVRRTLTNTEISGLKSAISSLRENPSFLKTLANEVGDGMRRLGIYGKAAGAVLASGMAMASGANAAEIGAAGINAVAPGAGTLVLGQGPSEGRLCRSFGEATGALAGGATVAAGVTLTGIGAVGAFPLSGPLGSAAVVGVGSYATVEGAQGAEKLGAQAGEAACNTLGAGLNKIKNTFGFGS